MAYFTQPDYVKYVCSCGQLKPITSLYFCRHCLKIRCGFCICHEVDSHYCANCLENMPSSEARLKKNRCSSCFDCPSCFHTLSTRATLAQPRPSQQDIAAAGDAKVENKQAKKMYYLSCFNCRWTSRDVGIPDQPVASGGWPERSNPFTNRVNQLLDYYKAIALQEKQDKLERERKKFAIRGKYITLTDKTGLTSAMARNIAGLPSSDAGSSSAIAAFTPSQATAEVAELPDDVFTKDVNLKQITNMEQRLACPWRQPACVSGLHPLARLLAVKRSQRCRACDHNLTKPEYNPGSIKFKIELLAYYHVPEVKIISYETVKPGQKSALLLKLTNPTGHEMQLRLIQPEDIPVAEEEEQPKSIDKSLEKSLNLEKERADVEWKFARSKLWISYFEEGGTSPPPFNVIPSPKSLLYAWRWLQRRLCGHARAKREHMRTIRRKAKQANERDFRYQAIMRNLVRRYVTVQQRRAECGGVTEDDVNEIKQDVSAFRCELVEILRNSGMNTSTANAGAPGGGGGKKNRQKERRLMKGFNIAPGGTLAPVDEFLASLHHEHGGSHGAHHASLSALLGQAGGRLRASQSSLSDSASTAPQRRKAQPHKRRWGTIIEAARAARVSRLIGRSRSEDSVCDHARQSPSGSERSESGSDSQRSPDRTGGARGSRGSGALHPLTALAALKRKRKKFSDSRRTAEERARNAPQESLQRASSVPARAPPLPALSAPSMHQHPHPPPASAPPSPAATPDPAGHRGGSREPLLASLDDDAHKQEACNQCGCESSTSRETGSEPAPAAVGTAGRRCSRCAALARLAGVTPLHGHAPHHSAGWL